MENISEVVEVVIMGPLLLLFGLLHDESGFFLYQLTENYGTAIAWLVILLALFYVSLFVWGIYKLARWTWRKNKHHHS